MDQVGEEKLGSCIVKAITIVACLNGQIMTLMDIDYFTLFLPASTSYASRGPEQIEVLFFILLSTGSLPWVYMLHAVAM